LVVLTCTMVATAFHVVSIAWTWYVAIGACVTFVSGWTASALLVDVKR
jgi:hypothetical protein